MEGIGNDSTESNHLFQTTAKLENCEKISKDVDWIIFVNRKNLCLVVPSAHTHKIHFKTKKRIFLEIFFKFKIQAYQKTRVYF